MAEVKTMPLRGKLVDVDKLMDDGLDALKANAGGFDYYVNQAGAVAGMLMICPCGCGNTGSLSFKPANSPSWSWDGNRDAPTLSPSVYDVGHWHGWLKAGVWESC